MRVAWGFVLLLLCFTAVQAEEDGEPPVVTEVVQGVVLDRATGEPLAGATVAVRTRKGRVLAWGKTDAEGLYRLDGRYVAEVNLPAYKEKNRSLLGQITRGAGSVLDLAARNAAALVRPVAKAAASAVGGPVAGAVAGEVAERVTPQSEEPPLDVPDPDDPGVFLVKVVCPNYRDYLGPVQAFWLNPPDADAAPVLTFSLDPVGLAPRDADEKLRSGPFRNPMRLRNALLEPGIAARNSEITLAVHLDVPPMAEGCVKLLARHDRSGAMAALLPVKDEPGLFRGKMLVGIDWPLDDQRITLLALRAAPASPQGPRSTSPEELADRLSLWRSRSLAFDPQILASRDRETLTVTVVD